MKIRSVTVFADPGWPLNAESMSQAAECARNVRAAAAAAGFEVQTLRLATPPFLDVLGIRLDQLRPFALAMDAALAEHGFDYASLGPLPADHPAAAESIVESLSATSRIFLSAVIAEEPRGISRPAVRRAAEIFRQNANASPDGFVNLRFAALACVPPYSPYFPAAHHGGGRMRFAFAAEAADLAVEAFAAAQTVGEGCAALTRSIEQHARALELAARSTPESAAFAGIDFCLAPFPEDARSIGAAIERMGVPRTGLAGSVLAATLLTAAIDAAGFARTGFCGLMFPVFEDAALAAAAGRGELTLADLLLYSTVCGTGLDTVPLPGSATAEQIEAVLLDLSALALRHDKPLTARLMPIPGKEAGETVSFNFDYFAPTRVLPLPAEPLTGPLAAAGEEWLPVRRRHGRKPTHSQ